MKKGNMKKSIYCLGVLMLVSSLIGCTKKDEETATSESIKATETTVAAETNDTFTAEDDGFILFDYSYHDGKSLKGSSSDTIEVVTKDNITTYNYKEHVLSCGTHMNGSITEETEGSKNIVKGSFDVTNNKYEITELKINYTYDTDTEKYVGTLTVNGKDLDINDYMK